MRSKDRLPDLLRRAGVGDNAVYAETTYALDATPADAGVGVLDKELDELFQEAERTRGWIADINRNTQLVRRLHADATFHTNKYLQEQLDAAVTQSNATGLKVCGALRQLAARVEAGGEAGGAGGAGADTRLRIARLQSAAARRLYADALGAHLAALHALRDDQLHLLHAQVKLTNMSITDEECQTLLDTNNISLFVDNVRAETAQARLALRDAEARRDELRRVEAALRDVRDLFAQLAHLVALQQDQVDRVEYYALQAGRDVEAGGRDLRKGTVRHRSARHKKVSLIICLVSGFLIVLLVLIAT